MFKNNFYGVELLLLTSLKGGYNLGGRGLAASDTKTNGSMNKKRSIVFRF